MDCLPTKLYERYEKEDKLIRLKANEAFGKTWNVVSKNAFLEKLKTECKEQAAK
jgi:hypothetical protein